MEILAAIALGFGAGGIAYALRRLSGGRIPRGIVPVAAGLAMLGFGVWIDYSWFSRRAAALPEGVVVVSSVRESSSLRPWTWAFPYVTRFAAVNVAGAQRNEALPGHVLASTFLIGRHVPPATLRQIVDCAGNRRAELVGEVRFGPDGLPQDLHWIPLAPGDPVHRALCAGAAPVSQG